MRPILDFTTHKLTVAYDSRPVLDHVSLTIPSGTLTAIIGPNGAGKTTLLKAALSLIKPLSGTITYSSKPYAIVQKDIAYVPQSDSVDWNFPTTVLDVVMMGRYGHLGLFHYPRKKEKQMALETLATVGMESFAKRQIGELSGGQQQRVFLARALIQQASLYFMDEPFKGVDLQTEKIIIGLLKNMRDQGKTIIMIHHDLQSVCDYFDWVTMINHKVIANGPLCEVFHEENIQKTYNSSKNILIRSL